MTWRIVDRPVDLRTGEVVMAHRVPPRTPVRFREVAGYRLLTEKMADAYGFAGFTAPSSLQVIVEVRCGPA